MKTPKSLSHLAPGVQCPHPRPSPGIWIPGNSQSPRDSHPPPAQRCFWGQAAFPRSSGPCWPRQHAENKNHLPHLCFPGRGIGKGETERETNSSVYLSVHGSSSLGCSSQTDPLPAPSIPPAPGPTPMGQSCRVGSVTQPSPSPLPQILAGRTFPLLGKPQGPVHARNSSKHFTLFIFPQLHMLQVGSTSGCPVLAELPLLLHWDGFQYSSTSPRPWTKSHCRGIYWGCSGAGVRAARMNPPGALLC